jgi:hypothetical protein
VCGVVDTGTGSSHTLRTQKEVIQLTTSGFPFSCLEMHPSRGQKYVSQRLLNLGCREDEGEQSMALLHLPSLCTDLCAVLCCHAQRLNSARNVWLNPTHLLF